jgi:hypothetical protein
VAQQTIKKGEFVIEYVGELITMEEYRNRSPDCREVETKYKNIKTDNFETSTSPATVLRIRRRFPYCFVPPGSISTRYRSGFGSFYHQAKIVGKPLILTIL